MSTTDVSPLLGLEHETEAAAGVILATGERWWGTRIRYRRPPARKWEHCTLVGVHPFDTPTVLAALEAWLTRAPR